MHTLFLTIRDEKTNYLMHVKGLLGTDMEPICGMSCIIFGVDDVTNYVISQKVGQILKLS